jgi:hypothetical protein
MPRKSKASKSADNAVMLLILLGVAILGVITVVLIVVNWLASLTPSARLGLGILTTGIIASGLAIWNWRKRREQSVAARLYGFWCRQTGRVRLVSGGSLGVVFLFTSCLTLGLLLPPSPSASGSSPHSTLTATATRPALTSTSTVTRTSTSTATRTPTRTSTPTQTDTPSPTVRPGGHPAATFTSAPAATKPPVAATFTSAPPPTAVQATSCPPGTRTGAVCVDGTTTSTTGKGACSHHGGVAQWLGCP